MPEKEWMCKQGEGKQAENKRFLLPDYIGFQQEAQPLPPRGLDKRPVSSCLRTQITGVPSTSAL